MSAVLAAPAGSGPGIMMATETNNINTTSGNVKISSTDPSAVAALFRRRHDQRLARRR